MLAAIKSICYDQTSHQSLLSGSLKIRPAAEFFAFAGHFPSRPILPAILQIKLGLVLCEELTGRPLALQSIERAKFMLPVEPGTELLVQARLKTAQEPSPSFRAAVELSSNQLKVASFSLNLKTDHEAASI